MKKSILSTFTLMFCSVFLFSQSFFYSPDGKTFLTVSQEKILVKFKPGTSFETQQQIFAGEDQLTILTRDMLLESVGFTLPALQNINADQEVYNLLSRLEQNENIVFANHFLIYEDGTLQGIMDRVILKLRQQTDLPLLEGILDLHNAKIEKRDEYNHLTYYIVVDEASDKNALELANLLHETGHFEYSEPDFLLFMDLMNTNDPLVNSQWSLNNDGVNTAAWGGVPGMDMSVFGAWTKNTGSQNIRVAIIDTGTDQAHPDLAANLDPGFDATGNGGTGGPYPQPNAHGTACAGIVAGIGNNNLGVAGVAYGCRIVPIRIFFGTNNPFTMSSWISSGINWAWNQGNADVLSNSWGGGSPLASTQGAIDNALASGRGGLGSPVLFSAGNDNNAFANNPSAYPPTISVIAMSMCGERKNPASCDGENFWGSSYGTDADIAAPGVKIHTTDISGADGYNGGDYTATFNGTSSACPNAAGVMALILSQDPTLTAAQARTFLEGNCDKVGGYTYNASVPGQPNGTWSSDLGYGLVNAEAAVCAVPICMLDVTCPTGPFNLECITLLPPGPTTVGDFIALGGVINDSCNPPLISSQDLEDSGLGCLGAPKTVIRTVIVTDPITGEVVNCPINYIFQDITPPVIVCPPALTIECGASTDPSNTGIASAADNCAVAPVISFSDQILPGICPQKEIIIRIWGANDDCGTTANCTQTITVVDTSPPTPPAPPADVNVQCAIDVPPPVNLTAVDICDGNITVSPAAVITPGNCINQFVMVRTWTFIDQCGNQSSVSQTITVNDTQAPVITCPANITIECTASTDPANTGSATAIDNCDPAPVITFNDVSTQTTTGCGQYQYTITRIWTATDNCDNNTTCVQTINVVDTTPPIITCPPGQTLNCFQSVPNPINTPAGFVAAGGTISDNCTVSLSEFTVFSTQVDNGGDNCPGNARIVTRTYYIQDACSNTSTCTQTFTYLESTQGPVITSVLPTCYKYCGSLAMASPGDITYTTDCAFDGTVTITGPQIIGPEDCPGTIYRFTYMVTDDCGRTSAPVTRDYIIGNDGPTIECPPFNLILECGDPNNDDYIQTHLGLPTANTSCELDYTITNNYIPIFGSPCVGSRVVTFTVTDACGRTATCTTTITILDTTAPEITSSYVPGQCDEIDCSGDIDGWFDIWKNKVLQSLSATDNCQNPQWSTIPSNPQPNLDCINGEAVTWVTWVASDNCGNESEVSYYFKIINTQGPTFTFVPADGTIACDEDPVFGTATATDECGNVTISHEDTANNTISGTLSGDQEVPPSGSAGTGSVTGTLDVLNGTIVLNVSFSGLSGNTTASHLHNAPAGANGAVFLNLGPLGFPTGVTAGGYTATATLTAAQVTNTLAGNTYMNIHTEAVPSGELRAQIKVNTCEGSYTRTWTADNDCGPSSVASQTLSYQDTDGPVISGGSDTTVEYDGNGNLAELNAWLADNAGASATDDCNNVTWSNNYDPNNWVDDPSCAAGVRAYIDVTFTATDDCGNANDVTFRFNATDTTPPIVPDPPQDLDAECGTDIAPVDLTAVDNSDGDITVSPMDVITPGACDNQYTITRTWDFEDNCGNMSSVSQTINVDDTTPPVAPPPLAAVNIECGMDVPPIDLTALDVCDGDITVPPAEVNIPGTCPGQYTIVRTWTFVDDCGNSSSVSQTINVDDTTPPVPPQAPADVNVECGTNVPPVDLTAVDECVGDITVSPTDVNIPGTCPGQYTIERTWIFVDGCGNSSNVSQTINVNDTTPPDAPAPPADETIECTDAIIPPGSLTANDICEGLITVFPTSESQPGSCPVTTITVHTWTFVDACGNESSVSQTITYVDTTPPVITCPDNFAVQCIEDVPECVATNATAFDLCSGAPITCSQGPLVGTVCGGTVTNTYTAVDGCGNVSTCTQVITVDDTTPPVITDCDPTALNLFITNADPVVKCTKSATISFNATDNCVGSIVTFDYAIDFEDPFTTDIQVPGVPNGTSITIPFPIGKNVIDYIAIDACGNTTACSDTVYVFDLVPPSLNCASVEVFLDPVTLMVSVHVDDFASAADECCLHEIFFVLPNGDQVTTLDFDCDDYQTEANGAPIPVVIDLLFIDCFGKDSDCSQDLFILPPTTNACASPPPIGTLDGSIFTEESVSVEEVSINLTGGIDALNVTEADGYYAFPSLPMEENYSVTPNLNLDLLNGISTFDVVLILKHILEEIPLDSPYKMIAADINNSGTISTLDLIELRKVILLVNDAFPNNNSWRFMPADFVFPDATNPFATVFPESVFINGLEGSEAHDFVGVKIGDVNNSVQANGLLQNDDRSFDGQLVLGLKDRWLNAGQTYQVAFTAENFEDILGYQFTLEIDQTAVSFIDIDPAELGGLTMSNFGFQYLNKGVITTSWANAKAVNLQKGKSLFHVMLTAKENVLLSEVLSINPQYTKPEAYNKRLELWDVALRFDDNGVVEPTFKLHQNTPNPFYQETIISFELPEASFITLTVTDASGHELKRVEGNYKKGYNSVSISNDGLSSGLLYYRIITSRDMETKKMIYQE